MGVPLALRFPSVLVAQSVQELDWDPADFGTVLGWYNETSALTGTTDVTQWNDISGSGNHATASAGSGIDSTAQTINGKRVLTMTSTPGMSAGTISLNTVGTVLWAFRIDSAPGVNLGMVGNAEGTGSGSDGHASRFRDALAEPDIQWTSVEAGAFEYVIGGIVKPYTPGTTGVAVVCVAWDATNDMQARWRLDGVSGNEDDTAGTAPADAKVWTFGGLANASYSGHWLEQVFWSGRLAQVDMDGALDAVAQRWGLTLA